MKICAYVQESYAKQTYKSECLDARQFVGLKVIIDALERKGYSVDYAGIATVHTYDIVLVSLTADCDWWSFIGERIRWQKGNYKVIVGGAGVLHVTPFLPFGDYFSIGRGEETVPALVWALDKGTEFHSDSVIESGKFSVDNRYYVEQAKGPYSHEVKIDEKATFKENMIGCNHKCLFCGYTWHRKCNFSQAFMWDSGKYNLSDKECAMLDYEKGDYIVSWPHLRTTAKDGFSERLRFGVNKKIKNETVKKFLSDMIQSDAKPHQIKFFNICGYPTETESDWWEFIECLKSTEGLEISAEKQWSIVLHSTPFSAMPATPMACAPMQYKNYRGEIAKTLGKSLAGSRIYVGKNIWAVESMGTESLASRILSAIANRGDEGDTENIVRICRSKKFFNASVPVKQATLEKYFNVDKLFAAYTPATLPSRYLHTYAGVEKMWGNTPLEKQYKTMVGK